MEAKDKEYYWRKVNPPKRYTDEELIHEGLRAIAVRRVRQALENGTLARVDVCEVCGCEGKTVAHHWNGYNHPFDVWWICRKCNANLPHDRFFTLTEARSRIRNKCVKEWESLFDAYRQYYRWKEPCGVCGIWYPLWLMEDWGGVPICQHCCPDWDR